MARTEEPSFQPGDVITRYRNGNCMGYYLVEGISGQFEAGPCDPFVSLEEREAYLKLVQGQLKIESQDGKTFTYQVVEEKEVTQNNYWGGGTRTYMQRMWVEKGEWPYAVGPIEPYYACVAARRIAKGDGTQLRRKNKLAQWSMSEMTLISDEYLDNMVTDAEKALETAREESARLRQLKLDLLNPPPPKAKGRRKGRKRVKVVSSEQKRIKYTWRWVLQLECGHEAIRPIRAGKDAPGAILGCPECEKAAVAAAKVVAEAEAAKVAAA
jgi:hypothetical protein